MTDQEAFNTPEMKAILILSEGKDYEETTMKRCI
jgi:hypothetical protein